MLSAASSTGEYDKVCNGQCLYIHVLCEMDEVTFVFQGYLKTT